jgi:hypothetical protein
VSDLPPSERPELPPGDGWYDPELPFLAQLERTIARDARRLARAHAQHPPHPAPSRPPLGTGETAGPWEPARRGALRPRRDQRRALQQRRAGIRVSTSTTARIVRRSLTLVALLCLIGASAYGAHLVLTGPAHTTPNPMTVSQGALVEVAGGVAGSERWSLRLYSRGGELCRVLFVAESEASRCTPAPRSRTLLVTSAISPLRRYIFGVSGAAIAGVRVHAGALALTVATAAPDPADTRAAGLPAHVRYFVAILSRPPGAADPPALVRGLDAAGKPIGPARIDCAPTPNPRPCPLG